MVNKDIAHRISLTVTAHHAVFHQTHTYRRLRPVAARLRWIHTIDQFRIAVANGLPHPQGSRDETSLPGGYPLNIVGDRQHRRDVRENGRKSVTPHVKGKEVAAVHRAHPDHALLSVATRQYHIAEALQRDRRVEGVAHPQRVDRIDCLGRRHLGLASKQTEQAKQHNLQVLNSLLLGGALSLLERITTLIRRKTTRT